MKIEFSKYHGTGNDFILIDNRTATVSLTDTDVARLCHRRFGIGADGLMLLETTAEAGFRMVYYNSDGRQSSMCGNGGRCIVAFAKALGLAGDRTEFLAVDGLHSAEIEKDGTLYSQRPMCLCSTPARPTMSISEAAYGR
jgi:diaminopimelate epimerase